MKYILVTGGVISGVGKGIIASSIGTILKAGGLRVTSIKIDPYINIDAGTFSPYEHGLFVFCTHINRYIIGSFQLNIYWFYTANMPVFRHDFYSILCLIIYCF